MYISSIQRTLHEKPWRSVVGLRLPHQWRHRRTKATRVTNSQNAGTIQLPTGNGQGDVLRRRASLWRVVSSSGIASNLFWVAIGSCMLGRCWD
jgi:hypothetical protein